MEVVDGITSGFQSFLQNHGWKMVGCVVAFYMIKDDLYAWIGKKQKEKSLAVANDPRRVATLEEQRRLVVERKQAASNEELKAAREDAKKKEAAKLLAQQERESRSSDLNPLDGYRGGGSDFRPQRRIVNPSRGGG